MEMFEIKKELTDGTVYTETGSLIRKLSYDIVFEEYMAFKNKKILEIGPRYSRWALRKQLQLNGSAYYSITGSLKEKRKKNTVSPPEHSKIIKAGNYCAFTSELGSLFEENFFDVILGIQSFEHWREVDPCETLGKNALKVGIENCYKILKSGGLFLQDFPIAGHGDNIFRYGKYDEIKSLFDPDKWNLDFKEIGKDPSKDTSFASCEHTINDDTTLKCSNCCWLGFIKAEKK